MLGSETDLERDSLDDSGLLLVLFSMLRCSPGNSEQKLIERVAVEIKRQSPPPPRTDYYSVIWQYQNIKTRSNVSHCMSETQDPFAQTVMGSRSNLLNLITP